MSRPLQKRPMCCSETANAWQHGSTCMHQCLRYLAACRPMFESQSCCCVDLPKCLPLTFQGTYAQCRYHHGYLTIHFESHKYQDIELSPLQHEAVW